MLPHGTQSRPLCFRNSVFFLSFHMPAFPSLLPYQMIRPLLTHISPCAGVTIINCSSFPIALNLRFSSSQSPVFSLRTCSRACFFFLILSHLIARIGGVFSPSPVSLSVLRFFLFVVRRGVSTHLWGRFRKSE